jgi:hypothetical protein
MAMVIINRFSVSYARSLIASTPDDQLAASKSRHMPSSLRTGGDHATRERKRHRQVRAVEQTYSSDQLNLMLAAGYITARSEHPRVRFVGPASCDTSPSSKLIDLQKAA